MLSSIRLLVVAAISIAAVAQTSFASNPPVFDSPPDTFFADAPPGQMVMGDFDGDGIPDVAVYGVVTSNLTSYGSVEVFFGDGKGGFKTATSEFTVSSSSSSYGGVAAGDLNGDGQSELVFAAGNAVPIYGWNGTGFTETKAIDLSSTGIAATKIAVGDLTAKASRDILVSDDFGAVGVVWIPNDGKGDFGAPTVFPAAGVGGGGQPILADLRRTGRADVILPAAETTGDTNKIVGVLLNNGDGTLASEVYYSSSSLFSTSNTLVGIIDEAVADVDGDGWPDLICACYVRDLNTFSDTYYLSVNLGNGDGTFQDGKPFEVTNSTRPAIINAMAVGDINGDGITDVATIDYTDRGFTGFTVTEFTGTGPNLSVLREDQFSAAGVFYNSILLGYNADNGAFVTFNKDTNIDVILGTTSSIYDSKNVPHHQIAVFKNVSGGLGLDTLPPTTLRLTGTITAGAPIHITATQTSDATGIAVRIQYTTTPTNEASWTDLLNGGYLKLQPGAPGTYSFGTAGTLFYLVGKKVYFRAISSAQGYTDSISTNILGPYTLAQGAFKIGVTETSTSDPNGKLGIVHLGDTLNYTFTWTNIGNATAHGVVVTNVLVPIYQDATTDVHTQFASNNLVFNQYGHYIGPSSPGAMDAQVWWNVADLPAGSRQSVTLGVKTGQFVRLQQDIGIPNSYEVYSKLNEPPFSATGFSSGAPDVADTVAGPLYFSITPDVVSVAPGGLINYTMTIENFGSSTVSDVVIADPVPEFTDFVKAAFVKPAAAPALKVLVGAPPKPPTLTAISNPLRLIGLFPPSSLPLAEQGFLDANTLITMPSDNNDEVVFYIGSLAKGASAIVRLTVQAQYIDPDTFTDQEVKNQDYLAYFKDASGDLLQSKNGDGNVFTPVVGTVQNAPNLSLQKLVFPQDLTPGDTFLVGFAVKNNSATAADDVFIQDLLPAGDDGAVNPDLLTGTTIDAVKKTVLPGSNILASSYSQQTLNSVVAIAAGSKSLTASANYFVTLDSGGTITVHGLHVEPQETIGVGYAMKVPATTPVPESLVAGASFIGAGNGDRTTNGTTNLFIVTTPVGTPQETPMTVNGKIDLFTPSTGPIWVVPSPLVSPDPSATSATLDTLYHANSNATLIVKGSNPPAPIPGVQRYQIHYQNLGSSIANNPHLLFPTPTNTVFYRASLVENGKLLGLKKGQSITEPAKLSSGKVVFNLGNLTNGDGGYAMVEVILLPNAINANKSRIVPATPLFYTGAEPSSLPKKLDDSADSDGTVAYDGQNVPHVGIVKIVPRAIQQGAVFAIQCAVFDYGNVDDVQTADVRVQAPAGTEIVYLTGDATLVSSNSTSMDLSLGFGNHLASGFNVEFRVTGAVTNLAENAIFVTVPYVGTFSPAPSSIEVTGPQVAFPDNTITTVLGAQFVTMGEMTVIPLGPYEPGVGSALVCGPTGSFGDLHLARTLSDAWGTTMVVGPAQNIHMLKLPVLGALKLPVVGDTDARSALSNLVTLVGKHGGNIFNTSQDNLIAPDGESFIDNNTGLIAKTGATLATVKALLKAGAQTVVPSGAGVLQPSAGGTAVVSGGTIAVTGAGYLLTSGGGVVSNDGGSVVSNDGGSLIGQDGSGLIGQDGSGLIGHDGGSLIGQDGSGLIGQDGSGLISSPTSAAQALNASGNIVAGGGGNIVAGGGGN
jgi:uncharacterized repeat protein (TIGR01451 family)